MINFSRGQRSLYMSESRRAPPRPLPLPPGRHGLLVHITCSRDGTIETRIYEANIPLNAPATAPC